MPQLGAPELIIILVIIVLIFGVGKLPEVGQALGKGIREFRGAADSDDPVDEPAPAPKAAPAVEAPRQPIAVEPRPGAPAVAASTTPAPVTAPVAASTVTYTVVEGDTLDAVAVRHGVTVEELMAANGYSQKDRILYAGDKLTVPAANKTA